MRESKINDHKKDQPSIRNAKLYIQPYTKVLFEHVPPKFDQTEIIEILKEKVGDVAGNKIIKDEYDICNGKRLFLLLPDDLKRTPIPRFITIDGLTFTVRYEHQPNFCEYCSEPNHEERSCPIKRSNQEHAKSNQDQPEVNNESKETPENLDNQLTPTHEVFSTESEPEITESEEEDRLATN
ncbi:unnamed protein product [Clavelina lepadiformis]|uniref:DUF4283 domain-containing protein n=1 Tax=Clavelina lepadiformis TaxID=159417 RepID=A0ABP0GGK2_CLALP